MNKTIIFLMSLFMLTSVFAEQNDYYIHPAGAFKIIPPAGFDKIITSEDGIQFNHADKSFLSISFSAAKQGYTDDELLGRFNNNEFKDAFIKGLEKSSASFKTKVVDTIEVDINGISAWEFMTAGLAKDGNIANNIANNIIICYKNNKEFFIIFSKNLNSDNLIKQSLASFEVLK